MQVTPPASFGVQVQGGPPPPLELAPLLDVAPLLEGAPLLEVEPPEVVPPPLVEVVPLLEPPWGLCPLPGGDPELLTPLDDTPLEEEVELPLLLPPGGGVSVVLPLEPPPLLLPDAVPPDVDAPEDVVPLEEGAPLLAPLDDVPLLLPPGGTPSDVLPPELLVELGGGHAGLKSPKTLQSYAPVRATLVVAEHSGRLP